MDVRETWFVQAANALSLELGRHWADLLSKTRDQPSVLGLSDSLDAQMGRAFMANVVWKEEREGGRKEINSVVWHQ